MKGTAVSTWIKTSRRKYGDATVNQALSYVGLPNDKLFSPLDDVDEDLVIKLFTKLSQLVNVAYGDLWRMMGRENIETFAADYPGFFRQASVYQFLKSMNDVHVVVVKRFPGAKPPRLDMVTLNSRQATFTYSSRRGMFDYFLGLVDGAAKAFY